MTARNEDLYAVLGVAPDATAATITRAFRDLLRRQHPDTRGPDEGGADEGGAPAGVRTPVTKRTAEGAGAAAGTAIDGDPTVGQVVAAYTVLHDPARRAAYDAGRRAASRGPARTSPGTSRSPGASTSPGASARTPTPPPAAHPTTARGTAAGPVVVLGEVGPRARHALGRLLRE